MDMYQMYQNLLGPYCTFLCTYYTYYAWQDHIWWIDLCFFVGFLGSFIMEKYLRA